MNLCALTVCAIFFNIAPLRAANESASHSSNYELKAIALPSANGPVALDYFAYDSATGKICSWPAAITS